MDIIIGRHPVKEYILADKPIEKLFFQRGIDHSFFNEIRRLALDKNIPFQVVPKEKISKFSSKNHQGIVATIPMIKFHGIDELIKGSLTEFGDRSLLVLLDGITDVRNFGSIARSVAFLGAQGIIISDKGSAPVNEIAIKTSAGALNKIPIARVSALSHAISKFQENGIYICASSLNSDIELSEVDFCIPCCIVIGAEDKGISKEIEENADILFKISGEENIESLNAAVASGIIAYEIRRQRSQN